jgi:nitrite reductase/ring-hydroxylating ferredoxin subunit/multimeric flavodoxin WrbA
MDGETWIDLGETAQLRQKPLQTVAAGKLRLALSYKDGRFGSLHNACNHVGGPLGEGRLDGDYVVCPWHHWKFQRCTGVGEPGFEADRVPSYELREEHGHLFVRERPASARAKAPHAKHPLERSTARESGPLRVLGLSTTIMDPKHPRYSTSEALLDTALEHARDKLSLPTKKIALRDLQFRACEGYYSKAAAACTWPCSITQMDPKDQMEQVYEALVFWADVVLVATPIRWGAASALYFKMAERLNCVQNQVTIKNRVLLRDKVASFVITGGQDNVQAVAGQMLLFFAELGFHFPQFPFIAHSRGWTAEDMEKNVAFVQKSQELHQGARELVERAVERAGELLAAGTAREKLGRGGRKAHALESD